MHKKHSMREIILGNLQIIAHWSLRILPIGLCSNLGCLMGRLLGPRHRQATQRLRNNIRQLRPDISSAKQIEKMIRRSWGNYGRVMAEFSVLQRLWKSDRTTIDNLEHFNNAKARGKPVIFPFLHLGNWEVLGPKIDDMIEGHGIQIYQMLDDHYKMRIAENVRRPYADALITNGPFVGKKICNKLNEGYFLNIAVDEFMNNELTTPSFGRPINLTGNLSFAVRLAKLTNAVLCPAYLTRTKGARFVLHFLPAIAFDFTDFDTVKLREAVEQLDQLIDPIIRQYFDQWYYGSMLNLVDENAK